MLILEGIWQNWCRIDELLIQLPNLLLLLLLRLSAFLSMSTYLKFLLLTCCLGTILITQKESHIVVLIGSLSLSWLRCCYAFEVLILRGLYFFGKTSDVAFGSNRNHFLGLSSLRRGNLSRNKIIFIVIVADHQVATVLLLLLFLQVLLI